MSQYPECQHCGESVAEPVTLRSRSWQGDEAHGGMVEYEEERCALCVFESRLQETGEFTEEEIERIVAERRSELLREAEVRP